MAAKGKIRLVKTKLITSLISFKVDQIHKDFLSYHLHHLAHISPDPEPESIGGGGGGGTILFLQTLLTKVCVFGSQIG